MKQTGNVNINKSRMRKLPYAADEAFDGLLRPSKAVRSFGHDEYLSNSFDKSVS